MGLLLRSPLWTLWEQRLPRRQLWTIDREFAEILLKLRLGFNPQLFLLLCGETQFHNLEYQAAPIINPAKTCRKSKTNAKTKIPKSINITLLTSVIMLRKPFIGEILFQYFCKDSQTKSQLSSQSQKSK